MNTIHLKVLSTRVRLFWILAICLLGSGQALAIDDKTPVEVVQSFINTMNYQYLSAEDRQVWSEQEWQQIQQSAAQADEIRLPSGHTLRELEELLRNNVKIEAVSHELLEDGDFKVATQMQYPILLNALDDFIDTGSSQVYELLTEQNTRFLAGDLNTESLDMHRSEMQWRVKSTGVFIDAAQMQENIDVLHAQDIE